MGFGCVDKLELRPGEGLSINRVLALRTKNQEVHGS